MALSKTRSSLGIRAGGKQEHVAMQDIDTLRPRPAASATGLRMPTTGARRRHALPPRLQALFEAGRDAAVFGDALAEAAHGIRPATEAEWRAWEAGKAAAPAQC
ncbi:MAG: hypothetical protein N2Z62_08245 [Rhodobacteraceae bacterium]|nr:hypothetical protein [Paracoccaceae bacterium]